MSKINLGIIFGGESSEYGVSLHSTASAIRNVDTDKYNLVLIGISQDGKWFLYEGSVDDLEHDKWQASATPAVLSTNKDKCLIALDGTNYRKIEIDCILPITHGVNGEDGTLQGLLELTDIPYVGCDNLCSAMSMDKDITHIMCKNADILMADYCCFIDSSDFDYEAAFNDIQKLKFPVFVKPANAGSSYGISKIDNDLDEFVAAINEAFKFDKKVIVETGIDGFEVGCAVLGNDYDNLTVGEVDEIDTNKDFFDFDAKYELTDTQIVCPARISEEDSNKVKENAKKIYKVMGCSGLARIDMFMGKDGEIYFNELNTIPGFTATSRYPSMMKEINIDFAELIDRLVQLALNK